MNPRKTRDIDYQLKKKGFKEEQRDHTFYFLYYKNKKTSVFTKISHNLNEYGDPLLSNMAKQLSLTIGEFEKLIDCPINHEKLIKILIDRGIIKL